METTVVLALILTLAGQKPTALNLPMPDVDTCIAELTRFLKMPQAPDKPHVNYRASGCEVSTPETPGMDTHEMAPPAQ